MKTSRRHSASAFTLLEIMVALALLGLVIGAIYSSWYAIMKGSRVALDASAASQRSRFALRTLQDALTCACTHEQDPSYYSFIVDSDGEFSSVSFVARLPKSFPHGGKFGDIAMRRLTFDVEKGQDGLPALVVRQHPIVMDIDEDEQNFPLVLARNIQQFVLRFPDPKTGEWTTEWTATNQLPPRIEIVLQLGPLDQFSTKPQDVMFGDVVLDVRPVRFEWQAPLSAIRPNPAFNTNAGASNNIPGNRQLNPGRGDTRPPPRPPPLGSPIIR